MKEKGEIATTYLNRHIIETKKMKISLGTERKAETMFHVKKQSSEV